jgi:hypothetical protein
MNIASLGQSVTKHPDLGELEQNVVKQFNNLRVKSGLRPLKFRRDLRLRMEACAIEVKGHAEREVTGLKSWYLTANPAEGNGELEQLALQKTEFDHVSVGVWFARTEAYPSGWYWVVVLPEHSAVHEAVWSHFYLTDDFEYQTIFSKRWKANLPKECRTIQ